MSIHSAAVRLGRCRVWCSTPARLALRYLAWGAALGLASWVALDPRWRDVEGSVRPGVGVPVAGAVALGIVGWTVLGQWARFGGWMALGLVGQAVALQLIEAGPLVRYQHYRLPDRLLLDLNPLLVLGLAIQTTLVAVGLRPHARAIRAWIDHHFRPWQVAALGGVLLLGSAAVARTLPLYGWSLAMGTFIQVVNLANVVLVVRALPEGALAGVERRLRWVIGGRDGEPRSAGQAPVWLPIAAAAWVVGMAAQLSVVAYARQPHITDEVAYWLHARFLAAGALTLPAPPVPEAFELYLMQVKDDEWYAATPPGWPALLALGSRLGLPWLVNPLLAGLCLLLTYYLIRELYDRHVALMVVLLLCTSPWFLFMSMNLMTHTSTLACALAGAVLVDRARQSGRVLPAGLAGVLVGVGSTIRPLDGLLVGVLLGLWALGVGGQRLKLASLGAFGLGAIVAGAAILPYNGRLTGKITTFPLNAYLEETFGPGVNDLGFGPEKGMGWTMLDAFPGHSPLEGLINANLNFFSVNIELFGWSIGSLLLVALLLVSGRRTRSDYLMLAVCAVVFGAYFFYYFSGGPDFGARYWYLMIVPLVVLTVRGMEVLSKKLGEGAAGGGIGGPRVQVAVLTLCAWAVVTYLPWRALDKYHHYWGMRPDVPRLAAEHGFGRSLVLIRGAASHPDFAAAAIYNPLDWHAPQPIYAWDRSPAARAGLLAAYPDRPVWLVDGPSITGGSYRVAAGPLAADELPAWAAPVPENRS